jgi:drug/metabolite transporter (DMT)-like permease
VTPTRTAPARWLILAAFAAIYIVWGSSYLGIHFALETMPPFFMAGLRFVLAGGLLIGWALLRGSPFPNLKQWRSAVIVGFMLFVLNNSLIVFAEKQGVPTGVVALLIATTPIWIVIINALRGQKPTRGVMGGIVLGFVGIALLIGPAKLASGANFDLPWAFGVMAAALFWALGSMYARSAPLPASSPLSTGMQLFTGGLMQLILSAVTGEIGTVNIAEFSAKSWFAVIYLVIFASIIAFTAFVWLMRVCPPERVSTYAYVNPVIAVFLGWALAGETLTPLTLLAAAIIVASVVMINASGKGFGKLRLGLTRIVTGRAVAHGAKPV